MPTFKGLIVPNIRNLTLLFLPSLFSFATQLLLLRVGTSVASSPRVGLVLPLPHPHCPQGPSDGQLHKQLLQGSAPQ